MLGYVGGGYGDGGWGGDGFGEKSMKMSVVVGGLVTETTLFFFLIIEFYRTLWLDGVESKPMPSHMGDGPGAGLPLQLARGITA
jgi:hypothetical protein